MKKPTASDIAGQLAEIAEIPICEGCDVLRGANLCARKHFGKQSEKLFDDNLSKILTTHVDLGCKHCPVDKLMRKIRKDRFSAIAAMF